MKQKHPYSNKVITTVLVATFFAGTTMGYIAEKTTAKNLQAAVIQNSALVRRVASSDILQRPAELIAYHTYQGEIIEERVGDDWLEPDADEFEEEKAAEPEESPLPEPIEVEEISEIPRTSCEFQSPEKPEYKGAPVGIQRLHKGTPGETENVTIVIENTGNMPWFSDESGCTETPPVQLGTMRSRDRESIFYSDEEESGWFSENRIHMKTPRVNPGEIGIFEFQAKVPDTEEIYREYFALVIPGVRWFDETETYIDFIVGALPYSQSEMLKKFNYLNDSSAGSAIDLTAKKTIDVDISEQVMRVKLGDYVVRKFLVSTGTTKNPTPFGNYKILQKQQWRIGGKAPHYIMPKWQTWRPDGYGIHSLPSLGNAALRARIRTLGSDTPVPTEWFKSDGFWTEANDHIGSRRSHGCVRLLPEDSDFVYDFTEVGTEVVTHE